MSARHAKVAVSLIIASFLAAHLCFWLLPLVFESWNARTVDQLFRLRDRIEGLGPAYDGIVIHVDINDTSLEKLGTAYLNRGHYARVVHNLSEMQVAAQVWDFVFASRTGEEEDRALIRAAEDTENAYFGMYFSPPAQAVITRRPGGQPREAGRYLERTGWNIEVFGDPGLLGAGERPRITFPPLAAAGSLGFLNAEPDPDGVYRRVPLLVRYGESFYPSIALRAACDYLGVSPDRIVVRPGKTITLRGARRPGGTPRDIVIPVDRRGNLVINFVGDWAGGIATHYDFADILSASDRRADMPLWIDLLGGKIAVVSDVSTGSTDTGAVPTDKFFLLSGLHANVIHSLLTESFLYEPVAWQMRLIEIALLAAVFLLSIRCSALTFSLGTLGLGIGYGALAAAAFLLGALILPFVRPLLMVTVALLSVGAYRYHVEETTRLVLRRSFESYFPPSIVGKIVDHPEVIHSGGQKKELTILFSDIKSFTTHSSGMTPDHVQALLNEYFDRMVRIVFDHGGTVDKFIGDGLMVFFGDPEPQDDHALQCVRAAIEMQEAARELRSEWVRRDDMPIEIRIGINTGEVIVGNMGSKQLRLSDTALGSNVNLAQRLETEAPVGGILISERTNALVQDRVETVSIGPIRVKGLDALVPVYEVRLDSRRPEKDRGSSLTEKAARDDSPS